MPPAPITLSQIQTNLRSPDKNTITLAMLQLVQLIKKDPAAHAVALKIFRDALQIREYPQPTTVALRGLEYLAGPEEARQLRLELLHDPRPQMVAAITADTSDPSFAPALIELLSRSTDLNTRHHAIRHLGRMRDPAALPTLLNCLTQPDVRAHNIEALADFNDPRAIPHLEPFLTDRTDAWPIDNHGPMLHISDLAAAALQRLRQQEPRP